MRKSNHSIQKIANGELLQKQDTCTLESGEFIAVFAPYIRQGSYGEDVTDEANQEQQTEDCHQSYPDDWQDIFRILGNN